jgi:hypothetical protein
VFKKISLMLALACAFADSLGATTISGTFDLTGSVTLTPTTFTWTSNGGTANQATIVANSDLSGSFVALGGTTVTIADLNSAVEPVGTLFADQNFINFLAAPTFPSLLIDYIAVGTGGAAGCTATPPAGGQTCTPAGSPFTFTNASEKIGTTTVIVSSVQFDFSGVTSDGQSSWGGIFTTQFNEPYQSVLTNIEAGSDTSAYSDSNLVITETTTTTPEPGTLVLFGSGLLGVAGLVRRKIRL